MQDDPDAILAAIEAWQPHREGVRQRAVAWMRSKAFVTTFYHNVHAPELVQQVLRRQMKPKKAAELWEKAASLGVQSPQLWQQYMNLATNGVVLFAQGVIVNPQFQTDTTSHLPCLFLVSNEQDSMGVAKAGFLAAALAALYLEGDEKKEKPQLTKLVHDDEFQLFRRRRLPLHETLGVDGALFDIQMRKSWMPPDTLPFVPLLALPGERGPVVQIPWFVVMGQAPTAEDLKPGQWVEVAQTERQMMSAGTMVQPKKSSSCFSVMFKMALTVVLIGCALGALSRLNQKREPDRVKLVEEKSETKSQPDEKTSVMWRQSSELIHRIKVVDARQYDPMLGEGLAGSGFVFSAAGGMKFGACSRHQFSSMDEPPGVLAGLGDEKVILDKTQPSRQPESWVQLVTGVTGNVTALEYRSDDSLQPGDELALILAEGKWITGKLTSKGIEKLSLRPTIERFAVSTNEDVTGASGSPVVHIKTGRVVGILHAADRPKSPTFLQFETLALGLGPNSVGKSEEEAKTE